MRIVRTVSNTDAQHGQPL